MRVQRSHPGFASADRRRFLGGIGGTLAMLGLGRTARAVPASSVPGLEGFSGPVAIRGRQPYEPWRRSMVWQFRKSERFPDMILQAETVDDVRRAVNFARETGRKLTTRAGGHSMSACFLRNGGVLLDVSRLVDLSVDVGKSEVSFGPGVIGRGVNAFLKPHGLAISTAHCGMVPLSGFMLGGGVGWNSNAWGGMAAFQINAVDIVMPDGNLRHVDKDNHPDLFWLVRGAGPGLFGVVVKFYVQCSALPKSIQSEDYVFSFADVVAVATALGEIGPKVDKNVELLGVVTKAPPEYADKCSGPGCDQAVFLSTIVFGDSREEADAKLAPLRNHPIMTKAIGKVPLYAGDFEDLYYHNELPFPQKRWQADNVMTNQPDKIAQLLVESVPNCPTDNNAAVLVYKGSPTFPDAAYSTSAEFYLAYYMVWDDPADDLAVKAYHIDFFKKAQKFAVGSYINEFNQEGRPEDISLCFSNRNWNRIAELRKKWDPTGVFHDFYGQS